MQLFQQQLKLLGSFGCRMENMANAMQKMAAGLVAPVIDTEVGFDEIDAALSAWKAATCSARSCSGSPEARMRPVIARSARALRSAQQWTVAQLALGALAALRTLPPDRALDFVDKSARRVGPLLGRHRVALDNLRQAYPEKSEAEITAIALDMWGNMARLSAEYIFLDQLFDYVPGVKTDGRIEVSGEPTFLRLAAETDRPHILFTGHLGNFELLPVAAAAFGLSVTAMFRPPNNPYIADYI